MTKPMTRYVALMRGINLASRNRVLMKDLTALFVEAGCSDVTTYIQSGNVLFRAPAPLIKSLPDRITAAITSNFGFRIPVVLRTAADLAQVLGNNPFLKAGAPENTLHVAFLATKPEENALQSLDPDRSPPHKFHVISREIYLHLPGSVANSKLTNAYFDSKLKTMSTVRNWATVRKLFELLQK